MNNEILYYYEDGSYLKFGRGKFDNWCIWCWSSKLNMFVFPRDSEYFALLLQYSHGDKDMKNQLYKDFVWLYEHTTKNPDPAMFGELNKMSKKYNHSLGVEKVFGILYLGMIAEENKENTKLGKRIKRLGMYQILVEGFNADTAANFSRGKNWIELDIECKKKGF